MSKLLKEAIADAKAVRETALANARLALEEAFAPRLQSMLTKKLKEEEFDLEDEELEDEVSSEVAELDLDSEEEEADNDVTDEVPGEEPGEDEVTDEDETTIDAEIESDSDDEDEDESVDEDTFDLDSIIKELEDDLASEDDSDLELEDSDEETEEVADETEEVADETEEVDEELDIDIVEDESEDESEDETEEETDEESEEETDEETEDDDEEINLEEILKELEGETELESDEGVTSEELAELKSANEKLQTENDEYRKVYKFLRGKLNEVNLLNAKLLYTNKLFKQHGLTEDQKIKVVESFDLTKNVREAKLVYATLGESFRTQITEVNVQSRPTKVIKNPLTEGLASKAIKSTKPSKQILSEGNELANRFKKLAGIKS
jgi:hypothetical protein